LLATTLRALITALLIGCAGCSSCGGGGSSSSPTDTETDGGPSVSPVDDADGGGEGTSNGGGHGGDGNNTGLTSGGNDAGPSDAGRRMDAGSTLDAGGGLDAGGTGNGANGAGLDGSVASDAGDASGPVGGLDAGNDGSIVVGPGCVDPYVGDAGLAPDVKLLINEIVSYPLQDWSRSDTNTNRFRGPAGNGKVDGGDQYVELYNAGSRTLNLTGFTLQIIDGSPEVTTLRQSVETSVSSGSSMTALAPGAYAVVGNPEGFASTDAYYVLRTRCGTVLDDVEIGGSSETRDFERDGIMDGAPSPDRNGRAHGAFDEAIARLPNSADTDDDIADFVPMSATPLAPNLQNAGDPSDTTAPQILSAPSGANVAVTAALAIEFDEPIDGWTADAALLAAAGGLAITLGASDFENADRRIIINPVGVLPFSSNVEITLAGVRDLSGNVMPPQSVSFSTEAAPSNPGLLQINEVVCNPRQDWKGENAGTGYFSGTPGTGDVGSEDEWIELVSALPMNTNLQNYTLTAYAGPNNISSTRSVQRLGASSAATLTKVRVFPSTSSLFSVDPGDLIVIGDPPGSLFSDIYIEVRNDNGVLLDYVEIGGNSATTDRGGDGESNGAPAAGKNGQSTGSMDEGISRVPGSTDTGNEIADFCYAPASLGAPNLACSGS